MPEQVFYGLIVALVLTILGAGLKAVISGDDSGTRPPNRAPRPGVSGGPTADGGGSGGHARTREAPSGSDIEPVADLRAVDLVVRNGLNTTPRIEVTLHNLGRARSIVKRARVEVRRFLSIDQCYTQGDLPVGENYDVMLPAKPRGGELVEVPVSRQLAEDEADRFTLSLGTDATAPGEMATDAHLVLYELEVSLLHDQASTPIRLGTVIVSLPMIPVISRYFSTPSVEAESTTVNGFPASVVVPCWHENNRKLAAFLSLPGERSPEMVSVASQLRSTTSSVHARRATSAGATSGGPPS